MGRRTIVPFNPNNPNPNASRSGLPAEPTFPPTAKKETARPVFPASVALLTTEAPAGWNAADPNPASATPTNKVQ